MLHILSICLIICRAFALNGRFYLQHFGALQLEGKERIKMDYCKCFYRLLNFIFLLSDLGGGGGKNFTKKKKN